MTSHEQALVIFARAPRPGQVKTRLQPKFTAEEACEVHVALLGDVAEGALRAIGGEASVSVAWSEEPPGRPLSSSVTEQSATAREMAPMLPEGIPTSTQPRGDLGERMALVIQERLRSGFQRVVILGSDAPTLPRDRLRAAFDQLRTKDVVIGPADDGGYYLVGMSRFHPKIFMKIRWGTDKVLSVTRMRLRKAGIAFEELGAWHDVDTPADIGRLWKDLVKMKKSRPEEVPHRTWSVLSRLAPGRVGT